MVNLYRPHESATPVQVPREHSRTSTTSTAVAVHYCPLHSPSCLSMPPRTHLYPFPFQRPYPSFTPPPPPLRPTPSFHSRHCRPWKASRKTPGRLTSPSRRASPRSRPSCRSPRAPRGWTSTACPSAPRRRRPRRRSVCDPVQSKYGKEKCSRRHLFGGAAKAGGGLNQSVLLFSVSPRFLVYRSTYISGWGSYSRCVCGSSSSV